MRLDLLTLQRELFVVGADLAANPSERGKLEPSVSLVTEEMVERLEHRIDHLVELRPLPAAFVVPGANPTSAAIDVARAIVRRAERATVALEMGGREANPAVSLPQPAERPAVRPRALAGGRERPATREP